MQYLEVIEGFASILVEHAYVILDASLRGIVHEEASLLSWQALTQLQDYARALSDS